MTKEEFNNLGVGKKFWLGYRELTVVEIDDPFMCDSCFLRGQWRDCWRMIEKNFLPECYWENRKDKKNVIFIEVKNND